MSLTFKLPDDLPPDGFSVEIRLQRIPEQSMVLKILLNEFEDRSGDAKRIHVYGRGVGSDATEKPNLIARISGETVRQHGAKGGNTLVMTLQDLSGAALDDTEMTVEGITIV